MTLVVAEVPVKVTAPCVFVTIAVLVGVGAVTVCVTLSTVPPRTEIAPMD